MNGTQATVKKVIFAPGTHPNHENPSQRMPACILLDEPTGNLDRNTALSIQNLMAELNEKLGTSYIVVTHDEAFADTLDRKLFLRDGMLHG